MFDKYLKLLSEVDNHPKNSYLTLQGTTSKNYFHKNNNQSQVRIHFLCGVIHCHRYDIPSGFNTILGYKYDILLFNESNELIAVGEKHPKDGETITVTQYDRGWESLKELCLSVHKDDIIDKHKIY